MIEVKDLFKVYATRSGKVTVLQDINFSIRAGEKIGILGGNGAGKSTLIRLISGAERPTSGSINRDMSVSWPLAFGGAFQGTLTGLDNFRFICRIHGVEWRDKLPFIEDFSELGKYLKEPVKTYSSGMRARLAFAISMTVEFDCFLIDEIVAVGDSRFNAKCNHELFEKRQDRAMIIVSHQSQYILDHCTRAAVLHQGKLIEYEDVDEALDSYSRQMQ